MDKIFLIFMFLLAACTSSPKPAAPPSLPTEEMAAKPEATIPAETAPDKALVPAKSTVGTTAKVPEAAKTSDPNQTAKSEINSAPKPVIQIWKLNKGKLVGPFAFGHPTVLSKSKNKKGNGTTTETCYRYATFAVVELKSSDEIGSAEIAIRHDPPKGFALCAVDFKGKTNYLKITEGYFAGVAGDFVFIDGADSSEGQTEFQMFQVDSGDEVMKSVRHPSEEFTIIKNGDNLSVEYFAKMKVNCELAKVGEPCWKEVLKDNKVVGKTPMPDCVGAFDKTQTPLTEPALVFTRARVAKPGSPPRFLGGKSTCQPAP
jgi:hypothetical protein